MQAIHSMHDYTGLCVPSVLQEALIDYLEEYNGGEKYISNIRQNVMNCFNILTPTLNKLNFEIPKIDGGYFIWAKLPPNYNCGFDFAEKLYKFEKIAVVPGVHFSENAKNYIRINVARSQSELENAKNGIERFILSNL